MFSVHTTPKELENAGFTLRRHRMFYVHTTPEEFENETITDHIGFVFEETRSGKSHDYREAMVFEKPLFFKN